jgi:hypothetical protein
VAAGAGLLALILLVLGVRGCLDARKERALKDYVQDVSSLTDRSDEQSQALFRLLSGPGGREQAVDIENSLNQLRLGSAQLASEGRKLDVPGDAKRAQRYLVESLEFRRDGLAAIADALPTALGDQERRQGTNRVTAQMQLFLASDIVYSQRFVPNLKGTLEDEELTDEVRIPRSQFLPDIDWLQPSFVGQRVTRIRTGRGGGKAAAPGLHGDGIAGVTLGGQPLSAGGGSTTVSLAEKLEFAVQVANQGENTETDVVVHVTIGKGTDAIELEDTLDTIAAGETKTVTIPLAEQPPTGQTVPVTVEVEPVPGEQKTDNNKQQYSVIFTR